MPFDTTCRSIEARRNWRAQECHRRRSVPLVLVLAALGVGATAGSADAQGAGNQAGFVSSGQTASLDCNGGKAEIMGSSNVLTITGRCTGLDLAGSNNKITIEFGPGGVISFVGSNNTIAWTSTDGKPPKVTYVGTGNTLTPPVR